MRISTANAYNAGIDSLMQRQNELTTAQLKLTSGKRVGKASDDPAAAARAERALAAEARLGASQRAVDASKMATTLTESALGNAEELLQQAREALVSAGNAGYSDADRKSLADTLRGLRAQLLGFANSPDGSGGYLFGGQGATQPPFVDGPGGVRFTAPAGQMRSASGDELPLTIDGQAAWMQGRSGNGVFETRAGDTTVTPASGVPQNATIDAGRVTAPGDITGHTYTVQFANPPDHFDIVDVSTGTPVAPSNQPFIAGQPITGVPGLSFTISGTPVAGDTFTLQPSTPLSVFDTLDRAIADLSTPGRSGAQIAQSNAANLAGLDAVLEPLRSARSVAGGVLNRIDNVSDRLSAQTLAAQTEVTNATDIDMTQALSAFANQQTGYDAALKSYAMVQRLSLFQYLSG
jgi:flagellar hook-associated protein 3 FlgL